MPRIFGQSPTTKNSTQQAQWTPPSKSQIIPTTPLDSYTSTTTKKFLSLITDLEDPNRVLLLTRPFARQEVEALFTSTVIEFHREWCGDRKKGGGLPYKKRNEFLKRALALLGGEEVEIYWKGKADEVEEPRRQEELIGESRRKLDDKDSGEELQEQRLVIQEV